MSRQEDFFNEATKQIKDSYVFQHDESYSDDDVRDIAISLAEHGYRYAIENAIYHIQQIYVQNNFKLPSSFEDDLRKRMEK